MVDSLERPSSSQSWVINPFSSTKGEKGTILLLQMLLQVSKLLHCFGLY